MKKYSLLTFCGVTVLWLGMFIALASVEAQTAPHPLRVICPATLGGWVDYPAGTTYARPAGGYLSISFGGRVIAIWGPNQWVRIEEVSE